MNQCPNRPHGWALPDEAAEAVEAGSPDPTGQSCGCWCARRPMVGDEPAADRLLRSLDYRLHPNAHRLTRTEVAVVLHALADHTAIMAALKHRPDLSSPWPEATSVGRWLHDVADHLEDGDE